MVKMKKIFMLMLLMLVVPFTLISASSEYTEEQLKQAGGLEKLLENERKTEEKLSKISNNYYESSPIMPVDLILPGGVKVLGPLVIENQENSYYCGPASVQTALHIINKTSESQSFYASSMGTNSTNGTYVYKVAEELDKRQSKNDYGWTEIRTNNEDDKNRLNQIIKTDIYDISVPMIARVYTENLAQYNGKKLVHYVTVVGGINMKNSIYGLSYADNFYGDYGNGDVHGSFAVYFDEFARATSYIIW